MRTILWVILGILILAIGGVSGYFANQKGLFQKKSSPTSTKENANTLQTYTNKSLNFSLKYPASWIEIPRISSDKETIFTKELLDPQRQKELEISDCLINESFNWANDSPVKEDCVSILAQVTAEQRKTLNVKISPKNVYIAVIQPKTEVKDLKTWLTDRFRTKDGELQNFEPGGEITLGGQKGYIVSIGCCADYDVAYVVQKGNLIYQLGTNDGDGQLENGQNSLLDEISKNFKFI